MEGDSRLAGDDLLGGALYRGELGGLVSTFVNLLRDSGRLGGTHEGEHSPVELGMGKLRVRSTSTVLSLPTHWTLLQPCHQADYGGGL